MEKYQNIENYPKKLRPIIKILLSYERDLSDGYHFYTYDSSDDNESIETLADIAEEILTILKRS